VRLPDQEARETARGETSRSLVVEASAGTGKTSILVARILELVLRDRVPLRRMAALTFTEKAAGEMKERVEVELEREMREAPGERRLLAAQARRELPAAEIGTIHAFCARLLRERPVEAGLAPDFQFPEEPVARELVREGFDDWALAEARREGSAVHDALAAGAKLSDLRQLAVSLHEERAALGDASLPRDPLAEARLEVSALRAELETLLREASPDERYDPRGQQVRLAIGELAGLQELDAERLPRWAPSMPMKRAPARRGNWQGPPRERLDEAWDRLKALPERLRTLPLEPLLVRVVASLTTSFFGTLEESKRRRGFVDFDDLLLLARDLLRRSPAARAHFRRQFQTLLVDEFQDTDPLQAEIVLRLSADEPQDPQDPLRWDELVPRPGALFLVGDPKQSIFRFRRADVETYARIAGRVGSRVTLTTSFRSGPGLLDYVNALFGRLLTADAARPWEVGYSPLQPPARAGARPGSPPVLHLAPPPPSPARLTLEDEARAVANVLLTRVRPGESAAVLLPRNEHLDAYRGVLRDAGLATTLEGGQAFYRREEISAAITALAAVDDPAGALLVVAALKSFLFAATDLELVEAAEAGARFDDLSTIPAGSPLRPHASLLLELHARRHERPLAETLQALLQARAAFAALEAGAVADPRSAVSNLERLIVKARALDSEGLSFSAAVRRLFRTLDDREAEPRAGEPEPGTVRLTTIHKAKGLEFDVVVVAGLGFDEPGRAPGSPLVSDHAGGEWGAELTVRGRDVRTPGYARLSDAEQLRREAERKRLLYVAFTRARKRLVLSLFRDLSLSRTGEVRDSLERTVLGQVMAGLQGVDGSLFGTATGDVTPLPRRTAQGELTFPPEAAPQLEALAARRRRVADTASRPLRRAGEKESPEDLPAPDRERVAAGRALAVGIAVHEAMEKLLSGQAPDVDALEMPAEDAAGEAAEVRRLVRTLLAHGLTARALSARRRFVELPLLYDDGGVLVEGKIDLLFEEADGYTIVDWKTDRVDSEEHRQALERLYAPQLEAYARGLRAVLGEATIKETRVVFARVAGDLAEAISAVP